MADRLRSLLPPVAYDRAGPMVGAVIDAEATAIDGAVGHAGQVSDAMHPGSAPEHALRDWERLYGLVPRPDSSPAERVQAVLVKLGELGGLSIPYFARLAASAGYAITIIEPRPFRCGYSRCGDALYGKDILFVWQVRIYARPAGATTATDAALANTFAALKPAHTFCQFLDA